MEGSLAEKASGRRRVEATRHTSGVNTRIIPVFSEARGEWGRWLILAGIGQG